MITVEYVKAKIEKIGGLTNDPEMAHCEEDDLYFEVIEAIAGGTVPLDVAIAICKETMTVKNIDFPRWCA